MTTVLSVVARLFMEFLQRGRSHETGFLFSAWQETMASCLQSRASGRNKSGLTLMSNSGRLFLSGKCFCESNCLNFHWHFQHSVATIFRNLCANKKGRLLKWGFENVWVPRPNGLVQLSAKPTSWTDTPLDYFTDNARFFIVSYLSTGQ